MAITNRGQFRPGVSGNPSGRRKGIISLKDLVQAGVRKHKIVERLFAIASGRSPAGTKQAVSIGEQMAAAKILVAYGWGMPTQTVENLQSHDVVIQVTYVQQNRIEVTGASPGPAEGVERGAEVQCLASGPAVRQIDAGEARLDS
jgi:Family of unknown function (DUF5681)